MSVAIGDLRRRVTIVAASDAPDGAGGFVRSWSAVADVFARIKARRRREAVDNGRQVGVVTHIITMRRRDDVNGEVRLVADGVSYRVLAVEDADALRRFQDCWCEEEQA